MGIDIDELGQIEPRPTLDKPANFERYTDVARRSMAFATQEAWNRGESSISVADLLAGLTVEENSRAERIGALKSNAFYLRWLVGLPALPAGPEEAIHQSQGDTAECPLELDSESQRALEFATLEADRDHEYWIDSDHLLRGILRFPNRAQFAVLKTEVDLHSARVASRHDREEFRPSQAPSAGMGEFFTRKYLALGFLLILAIGAALYFFL